MNITYKIGFVKFYKRTVCKGFRVHYQSQSGLQSHNRIQKRKRPKKSKWSDIKRRICGWRNRAETYNHQRFGGYDFETGVENNILENNIYGVNINEESVEIDKLNRFHHSFGWKNNQSWQNAKPGG